MLKIGITGGIGSGKTVVCKVFELFGIPIYYADEQAKKLMQTDKQLIRQIQNSFGKSIYSKNILNKKLLAKIVFNDESKLNELNALVHPAVKNDFENWVKKQKNCPYIIKEAALLFESGTYLQLDKIITVTAPTELRIKRIMKRDGSDRISVKKIMKNQMTDKEKISRSDFVIFNDEKKLLLPQILKLHKNFVALKKKKRK